MKDVKKTVKTTLIVVATLVVVYLAYFYLQAQGLNIAYNTGVSNGVKNFNTNLIEEFDLTGGITFSANGQNLFLKPEVPELDLE